LSETHAKRKLRKLVNVRDMESTCNSYMQLVLAWITNTFYSGKRLG